jgi:hypothetical protein
MTITTNVVIDSINITLTGIIEVRQNTQILKNGVQIADSYERWTLVPGQDITNETSQVKSICNLVWTSEIIAAYQAAQNPA